MDYMENNAYNYCVIDDYQYCESTYRSIFLTHFLSRFGQSIYVPYFAALSYSRQSKGLSFAWDKKLFHINKEKPYARKVWNSPIQTAFWFKKDLNLLKEFPSTTKHVYFPDYYNMSSFDIFFSEQCNIVACPTEETQNTILSYSDKINTLLFPTDTCYPLLTRKRFVKQDINTLACIVEDEITMESEPIQALLLMLKKIPQLKIVFIRTNEKSDEYQKELKKEYKKQIAFLNKPCDWTLHRLTPQVDWFIDLRSKSSSAWYLSLFNNADTICIGLNTPINKTCLTEYNSVILSNPLNIDELFFTLFSLFNNPARFNEIKNLESGYKERQRQIAYKSYAKCLNNKLSRILI